ncbi:MAG: response regulator [Anaerolineae bacterium]|nr:response regulator [Anaerolineae bacterium]
MDWETFEELIRYILANFYDYAALETNHQIYMVIKPPVASNNRAEFVRKEIIDVIEKLRPGRKEINPHSPDWRPYLILQKRYVEGASINDLASFLSISSRQLRRDHHRALEALTILLWNRFFPDQQRSQSSEPDAGPEQMNFEVHLETLDPKEILNGVYDLLKKRFVDDLIPVEFRLHPESLQVSADRVILRQILIGVFNEISHTEGLVSLSIKTLLSPKEVGFEFRAVVKNQDETIFRDEENGLETLCSWCERINARLEDQDQPEINSISLYRTIWLQRIVQRVVLVVDDQEPTINLFRRYLSQTNWKLVGTNHADQVLALARQVQPQVITLDVMMPQVDGWELLQTLKLDEETHNIPVIICSAWADPDLALSLGAAAYLKKPITQKQFLDVLETVDHNL